MPQKMATQPRGGSGRSWGGVRFALVAFLSLLLGHEAAYHAHHGWGDQFAARMEALGHDAYWPAFMLVGLSAAVLLVMAGAVRLARLALRSRWPESHRRPGVARPPSYPRLLSKLWIQIYPITLVAFAIQENVEHLLAESRLIWLGALAGEEYPLTLPVLALVTLALAALGAAFRWHVARLTARIARAAWLRLLRPVGSAPRPPGWWIVSALCARRWLLVRQHAVRAPPATK